MPTLPFSRVLVLHCGFCLLRTFFSTPSFRGKGKPATHLALILELVGLANLTQLIWKRISFSKTVFGETTSNSTRTNAYVIVPMSHCKAETWEPVSSSSGYTVFLMDGATFHIFHFWHKDKLDTNGEGRLF